MPKINPLASQLNETLEKTAPEILASLSDYGKRLFFPKGILLQSAEAKEKAHRYNATIGIATREKGEPMRLDCADRLLTKDFAATEVYPYAPSPGIPALRSLWQKHQQEVNPSLSAETSLPVACSGLTHGLSLAADLFVNPGDELVLADKLWGNYRLLFANKIGAVLKPFRLFDEELAGFDHQSFAKALDEQKGDKITVLLNFPNNPTGFSPSGEDVQKIASTLQAKAEAGQRVVVIIDDAYFGMFFEDSCHPESLFASLASAHPNLIAVKLDGCTKEAFMWGLRVGFVTIGRKDTARKAYTALEKKLGGAIRSTISNSSHLSQSFALKTLENSDYGKEKAASDAIMKQRYLETKQAATKEEYQKLWDAYPFNSGYFMCLRIKGVQAEALRVHLLDSYGVGTISVGEYDLRIAFSSVKAESISDLFAIIAKGVTDLQRNRG